MSDLIIAVSILACLSLFAFAAGIKTGCHPAENHRRFIEIVATALMMSYLAFLWNRPILTKWLPTSALIIAGNWLPVWGSFFLGIYIKSKNISLARRVVIGGFMLTIVAYSGCAPLLGQTPTGACTSSNGNVLQEQTTPYTCSAACAVSLLRLHGLDATEDELAKLCLTREGTHWLGLYRGMVLKTQGTEWMVTVTEVDSDTVQQMDALCILAINIDTSVFPEQLDHGFNSEVGHSVVYLGRTMPQCITVFDPSPDYGIEDWDTRTISCVKSGVALKLVKRTATTETSEVVHRTVNAMLVKRQLTAGL